MKANRNKTQQSNQNSLPSSNSQTNKQNESSENIVETTDKFNIYDISDPVEIFNKFD